MFPELSDISIRNRFVVYLSFSIRMQDKLMLIFYGSELMQKC